jgi:hypothetical protein
MNRTSYIVIVLVLITVLLLFMAWLASGGP